MINKSSAIFSTTFLKQICTISAMDVVNVKGDKHLPCLLHYVLSKLLFCFSLYNIKILTVKFTYKLSLNF